MFACAMKIHLGIMVDKNVNVQVLTKLAFKSSGLTSLVNQKFLSTISKQMKTDLTFDDLLILGTKYRVATHDMDSDFLQGTSEMINGESFEVASTTEKQRITNKLRKALGLSKAKNRKYTF